MTSVVQFEINFRPFYHYSYQKYDIGEVTGFNDKQLRIITNHLIQYFNGKVDQAQLILEKDNEPIYLFHDYELQHLKDVKALFQLNLFILKVTVAYIIFYFLLILIGFYKKKWLLFWKGIKAGSFITIMGMLSLGIAAYVNFYWLFIQFHYLVFGDPQNSPWQLDPRKDYLIMLYPNGFWADAASLGVLTIMVMAIVLGAIAWSLSVKLSRKN